LYLHFQKPFSSPEHSDYILKYLLDEVELGRMSCPFSEEDLRVQFQHQHFQTAPLSAVPKVGGDPGELRIVRNASYQGNAPCSVNDQINPDEHLTCWGKAADMAEIVSYSCCPVTKSNPYLGSTLCMLRATIATLLQATVL
jgi:hypothetical protein